MRIDNIMIYKHNYHDDGLVCNEMLLAASPHWISFVCSSWRRRHANIQEPVGLNESKREMRGARPDFHGFEANSHSIYWRTKPGKYGPVLLILQPSRLSPTGS